MYKNKVIATFVNSFTEITDNNEEALMTLASSLVSGGKLSLKACGISTNLKV